MRWVFRAAAAALIASAAVLVIAQEGASAAPSPSWLDTSSLAAVNSAYLAEFNRGELPIGYTGNPASCSPGTTSGNYRASELQRMNYYRRMAGVTDLAESSALTSSAQSRATLMSANGDLNHDVPATWRCAATLGSGYSPYSEDLYLGLGGTAGIDGYVLDNGVASAGHRLNIMSLNSVVGMGDVTGNGLSTANALEFDYSGTAAGVRQGDSWVSWPSPGYFPTPLTTSLTQWSFESMVGGDCSNASVAMSANGAQIPVTLGERETFGCNVVWLPGFSSVDDYTTYNVAVSNVIVNGVARTFTYSVVPFTPSPCLVAPVVGDQGVVSPALFRGGSFFLRGSYSTGGADLCYNFGSPGDVAVMGDWDGDGTRTPGVFRNGTWYLRNTNTSGGADIVVRLGSPGDVPVVGDWNQDGTDTIGVFRSGVWFLKNSNVSGNADGAFRFGSPGDVPVVGDWNNDGTDTLGVFRNGTWYLTNFFDRGAAEGVFAFGSPGDTPVPGDWNRDGTDTLGVYRAGTWYLSNFFDRGSAEGSFRFGQAGDQPALWR